MTATRPSRRRGVMLVEILLALAITGLVAAGVASLLFATASGTKERQALRQGNVRVDVLTHRMDAAIRSSSMLLARDSSTLVFWIADVRSNGVPDLSELRRIEWDNGAKSVTCYQAPATLAAASDVTYDLTTTDFLTTTAALEGSASFPGTVWANRVHAWTTSPTTLPRLTRLVGYGFTVHMDDGKRSTRSSAAMRGTAGSTG